MLHSLPPVGLAALLLLSAATAAAEQDAPAAAASSPSAAALPAAYAALDPQRGLFAENNGKHRVDRNVLYLLEATLDGVLDHLPVDAILANLHASQTPGGRFKKAIEDEDARDADYTGFVCLKLLALHRAATERDAMTTTQLGVIERMLAAAEPELREHVDITDWRYPNPRLNDLVVALLTAETLGTDTTLPLDRMREAFAYWRDHEWGWGEHMSDTYAKVCQRALAYLILVSGSLPADLKEQATELLLELERIDRRYGGGLRVPTIRIYAFERSPLGAGRQPMWTQPLLKSVVPLKNVERRGDLYGANGFTSMLHARGLRPLLATAAEPASLPISLFGGGACLVALRRPAADRRHLPLPADAGHEPSRLGPALAEQPGGDVAQDRRLRVPAVGGRAERPEARMARQLAPARLQGAHHARRPRARAGHAVGAHADRLRRRPVDARDAPVLGFSRRPLPRSEPEGRSGGERPRRRLDPAEAHVAPLRRGRGPAG